MRRALAFSFFVLTAACGKTSVATNDPEPREVEVIGAAGDPSKHQPLLAAASPGEVRLEMERQICYGSCPAYDVTIAKDGAVAYTGKTYVAVHGARAKTISAAAVEALAKRVDDAGFFTMTWEEPCGRVHTDDATVVLTVTHGGRTRSIRHYHGNECIPPALSELENAVDDTIADADWVRCKGGSCPGSPADE